ncbi:MAG: 50S ribosomal protein L11 methyltransferase [Thermoanaerobaculum sp.]|nr:50S ribosomal protein L11 methyltransferase [Thermoanaerobaculum sp.]
MSDDFLTLTFRLPSTREEELPLVLNPWPVLGCEVRDVNGEVEVTVYLQREAQGFLAQVKGSLQQLGAQDLVEGTQPALDWLGEYRQRARPFTVGERFWIDPQPAFPTPPPEGRIPLRIEPRQAFGTGSHESTQLMLLLLEEQGLAGLRVLDVGTGSGILALAAKALGACWVLGFDLDLEAVFVARETTRWHGEWPINLFAGPTKALRPVAVFDLIMANMLVEQFVPLLTRFRQLLRPKGELFLSGLLVGQKAAVASELAASGFVVRRQRHLGEWAALVAGLQ